MQGTRCRKYGGGVSSGSARILGAGDFGSAATVKEFDAERFFLNLNSRSSLDCKLVCIDRLVNVASSTHSSDQ